MINTIDEIGAYGIDKSRAERAVYYFTNKNISDLKMTGRGVMFLTNRCNLNCAYCKGFSYSQKQFFLEDIIRIIELWSENGCRYIHFTGGEPTLVNELPQIIKIASLHKMVVSLSTNGTQSIDFYRHLVENGLKLIYISLDSNVQEDNDKIANKNGTFLKVVDTIKYLTKIRDNEYKDIYITINTCINEMNFNHISDILKFLIELNPNDCKFILTTQFFNKFNSDYLDYYNNIIKPHLLEIASNVKMPFLLYRIENLNLTRGFSHLNGRLKRCYITLDERIVDSEYYFPCNIYAREGGKPLGSHLKDSMKKQIEKIWDFVQNHDISKDEICSNFCCDITREYNLLVDKLIKNEFTLPHN